MRRKKSSRQTPEKLTPMERRQKASLEPKTRQEPHPTTEIVTPRCPAGAKWRVEVWSTQVGDWTHAGYARDEAGKRYIADGHRALGSRVRSVKLTAANPTPIQNSRVVGTTVKPAVHTNRSLCRSLEYWLREVELINVSLGFDFTPLKAMIDACKGAVRRHDKRLFYKAEEREPKPR